MTLYILQKKEVFPMPLTYELVYEWEVISTSANKEEFKSYENNSDYRITSMEI